MPKCAGMGRIAHAPSVQTLRDPTDEEQWELGVGIVQLRNRLEEIAPRGRLVGSPGTPVANLQAARAAGQSVMEAGEPRGGRDAANTVCSTATGLVYPASRALRVACCLALAPLCVECGAHGCALACRSNGPVGGGGVLMVPWVLLHHVDADHDARQAQVAEHRAQVFAHFHDVAHADGQG